MIFVTEKVSVSEGFWLIGRRKVRLPLRPRGTIHPIFQFRQIVKFHDPPSRHGQLTIIPRARIGSESIAHDAEGRMGY